MDIAVLGHIPDSSRPQLIMQLPAARGTTARGRCWKSVSGGWRFQTTTRPRLAGVRSPSFTHTHAPSACRALNTLTQESSDLGYFLRSSGPKLKAGRVTCQASLSPQDNAQLSGPAMAPLGFAPRHHPERCMRGMNGGWPLKCAVKWSVVELGKRFWAPSPQPCTGTTGLDSNRSSLRRTLSTPARPHSVA